MGAEASRTLAGWLERFAGKSNGPVCGDEGDPAVWCADLLEDGNRHIVPLEDGHEGPATDAGKHRRVVQAACFAIDADNTASLEDHPRGRFVDNARSLCAAGTNHLVISALCHGVPFVELEAGSLPRALA